MSSTDKNRKRMVYPFVRKEVRKEIPTVETVTITIETVTTPTVIIGTNFNIDDVKIGHGQYDMIMFQVTSRKYIDA